MIRNFGYGGFVWIGMILGLVVTIALIIGFVYLVVWAVHRMSGNSVYAQFSNSTELTAKEMAKVRYAKGEISREEYKRLSSGIDL